MAFALRRSAGNAEPVALVENLYRAGVIEFPVVDVIDLQTQAIKQLGHGEHEPDAQLAAGDGEALGSAPAAGASVTMAASPSVR
jgi:hypothetical protein